MTTNYHTAIANGAVANAATFNAPLGQLDSAIGTNSLLPTGATTGATSQAQVFTNGVAMPSNITFQPITAPGAPTIGSITAGGAVDDGDHYYRITFVTANGETEFGTTSAVATAGGGNNTVNLTGIPTSSDGRVTSRRVYRSKIGTSTYSSLVTTIADNVTTTYSDTTADSAIAATSAQSRDNTTTSKLLNGSTLAIFPGTSNTIMGHSALASLTSGFDNTAVGVNALTACTTGVNNTALGMNTLVALTTGSNNTGIGVHAMQDETGSWNVSAGVNSMRLHTSGDYNVIVGGNALYSNETGTENTAVGFGSLLSNTGDHNVAVGFQAGYYETGSNKLFIDNAARASEADGRTKALIYGIFDAATANQSVRINGKLGVCMAPSNQLDVTGSFIGLTPATGTSYASLNMQNSGVQFLVGIEASAGANLFPGTAAYACVVGTPNNKALQFISNNVISMTIQNGSIGFFGHAVAAQPAKASHNNWAALSDVVAALVEIGIFDAA